jgi:hypothetical protein
MIGRADHKTTQAGREEGARRHRGVAASARAVVPERPAADMDSVAAAVLVCSAHGTVVDLNGLAASLLGVERATAIGTPLTEVREDAGAWVSETGESLEPAACTVRTGASSTSRGS